MSASSGRVPPGPPRRATLGLLRKLRADRLGLMSGAVSEYGDAVRVAIGPKKLYIFNHPDHAKHVLADNAANYHKGIGYTEAKRALGDGLLTSEGALWEEQRRTIQPVFQHKRIAAQADVIVDEALGLVERLRAHQGAGWPVDVLSEITSLTLGVLGRILLAADLGAFESVGHSFEAVQDQAMFEMETLGLVPRWLPLKRQRAFRKARADLERIVEILVAQRKANPSESGDDVLTRLISSTAKETDKAVADRRMRDELVTLLLAGHETTASTVGWTLNLVSQHPQVQDRLHEEAVAVYGDRRPAYEDLPRLRYTNMVLQETMRLRPPVWILTRRAVGDDVVGGYHVPAGAEVLICPYTLHRHPKYWDDPERFDPERFDPDVPSTRPRYAYTPFGAGPRFCVGNHLGMMESTFIVSTLMRDLRLEKVPGFQVKPEPMLSLRLGGGLLATIHPWASADRRSAA
ncbi:cytochrome P450 [Streptosporangium sp. NBC_01756]|uniref:cytochrome P450 n=1 Tax=Streptosporangium sp. NBC_01756 TaxID=2975950 RepID=UPI002DD9A228|nr:cytochrome P450 [Streptosporangium sp. NBC_01756]WSC85404.1 cytochrome P450 [Streptosporangium sp. NBC_01756]